MPHMISTTIKSIAHVRSSMTIANRATQVELTDLQMHLLEHSFEWLAQDFFTFFGTIAQALAEKSLQNL